MVTKVQRRSDGKVVELDVQRVLPGATSVQLELADGAVVSADEFAPVEAVRAESGDAARTAGFKPSSYDEEARSVSVTFSTGARGLQWDWEAGPFYEELEISESAIRSDRIRGAGIAALKDHRRALDSQVGVAEGMSIEGREAITTIRFSSRGDVEGLRNDVRDGIIRTVSVGYRVHKYEKVGEEAGIPVMRAVDWEPLEVSFVSIPLDGEARTRSITPLTERQPGVTEMTKPAETAPADNTPAAAAAAPAPVNMDQVRSEAAAAERARAQGIRAAVRAARLADDVADALIDEGVSLDKAREAVLNKLAEAAPPAITGTPRVQAGDDSRDHDRTGMTNMLMHRVNPGDTKLDDNGRRFVGRSLIELARHSLESTGVRTTGMDRLTLAARSMHTTGDFPLILADVAGKTLRRGYENAPRTFQTWARQATISDFKEVKRIQLGGAPDLKKVLEHGEYTHGTFDEAQEKYRLFTYGRIAAITREMIVNDDLDAFSRIIPAFGRAAADLESDIVYAQLTTNPVMQSTGEQLFSAPHANLGTAGAISITTLSEARQLMRKQKGLEGRYINLAPRFLVVGPNNETAAAQFTNSDYVPEAAANINPFAGGVLRVIVDPRIEDNSWYVLADPAQVDTVEYAYLEGGQGVTIETRNGFEVDGMEVKVRHDFASKAIDYRGMVKNPFAG